MRVLVDGIAFEFQPNGGISRIYGEILPRMCDLDDTLRILLLARDGADTAPVHARIDRVAPLPLQSLLRPARIWWREGLRLRSLAQRLAIGEAEGDVWHSTYYTMPPRRVRAVVVTAYDMIHERLEHLFVGRLNAQLREQKRRCIMGADAVICISETTRRDVEQFYGLDPSRLRVVPLAPSPVFRPLQAAGLPAGLPPDRPFLVYVGDRSHYKNLACLLQAYSTWPRRRELDLVVVGREWARPERQMLADLGIDRAVHLLTGVDDQSLCRIYNRATALVYPSLYEGFGIPVLEAMACGCPVVASSIASTREVAGDYPVYFDPTDAASLAAALDVILAEGRQPGRLQLGRRLAQQYSWDGAAASTLEVYRDVIAETLHG